jgi:hypothetical protein
MRSSIELPGLVIKNRGLYLDEFLAGIFFRAVQEVQFPSVLPLDLKLVILPVLQQYVRAAQAGHIMQVIAFIKTGAPPLFKGFRERGDLSAAD